MQDIITQDETDKRRKTVRSCQTQTSFSPYSCYPATIHEATTSERTAINCNQSSQGIARESEV